MVSIDLRQALRVFGREPAFALAVVLTLALGIGANTALYSVLYAVLLKPLPFSEPERLYWVYSRHTSTDRYPFSLPEFCDYRDRTRTLDGFAGCDCACGCARASITTDNTTEQELRRNM